RARIADEKLDRLLDLLDGASVGADRVRVTPAPFTSPRPPASWGGASRAAAHPAGSRGLHLFGSGACDGIEDAYEQAARAAGHTPLQCHVPQPGVPMTVFVSDDLDVAWKELGPYLMHDVLVYAEWNQGARNVASLSFAKTAEEL